jgi:hypothetical protein
MGDHELPVTSDFAKLSVNEYVYTPLSKQDAGRWIRVLDLHPSEDRAAPLRISLRTVTLERGLQYEAISYVWGSPNDTVEICIADNDSPASDCRPHRIRANLAAGLLAFRHKDMKRTLWADALCINQNDTDERSSQVEMMGLIFWLAESVLIWLGPDPDSIAQDVFDSLHPLAEFFWHHHAGLGPHWDAHEVEALDPRLWKGISALYANPWFTRVWVQQEVGLARYSWFHWGATARRADHHDVFGFDMLLERRGQHVKRRFGIDQTAVSTTREQWLNYGRSTREGWVGDHHDFLSSRPFLVILVQCANCLATDPRDHVYGFLGHPSARREYAYRPGQSRDYLDLVEKGEQVSRPGVPRDS